MRGISLVVTAIACSSVHAFVHENIKTRPSFSSPPTKIFSEKSADEIRREREQQIIEAGGDPFFLMDDDEEEVETEDKDANAEAVLPSPTLMGMAAAGGGAVNQILSGEGNNDIAEEETTDPGWEWDGEYDEEAYFD